VVQFESLEQRISLAPTALFILAWGSASGSGLRYGFSAEGAIHSGAKRRAINGEPED
jgi:hypothetical protein